MAKTWHEVLKAVRDAESALKGTGGPMYLGCSEGCLRASDVGVSVNGDPVAYAHPSCSVHGVVAVKKGTGMYGRSFDE